MVLGKSSVFLTKYSPPPLFSGKIRQTLFQVYVSKDKDLKINYERTNLKMEDGGTISVDWTTPSMNNIQESAPKRRVCVIFPGLSGGSDRGYIKSLVKTLLESGFEVAVLHNRGVGNTPYTSTQFADLTKSEPFIKMIAHVRN
jgi:predicted alpha/beta-fold hydrolase